MIRAKRSITGSEPITLEEAKAWIRVSSDADDTLITSLITEARELIEAALNHSIVEQTIDVTASDRYKLYLPYQPVIAVTSVTDLDGEDVSYTFNGFVVEFSSLFTSITTYTSGYAVGEIPDGLLVGLKEVIAYLYENRGNEINEAFDPYLFIQTNEILQQYNQVSWC